MDREGQKKWVWLIMRAGGGPLPPKVIGFSLALSRARSLALTLSLSKGIICMQNIHLTLKAYKVVKVKNSEEHVQYNTKDCLSVVQRQVKVIMRLWSG